MRPYVLVLVILAFPLCGLAQGLGWYAVGLMLWALAQAAWPVLQAVAMIGGLLAFVGVALMVLAELGAATFQEDEVARDVPRILGRKP